MQQFNDYFDQEMQRRKIAAKKKAKFKRDPTKHMRTPGPMGTPQSFNLGQSSVMDTAFKSTSTFVPRG